MTYLADGAFYAFFASSSTSSATSSDFEASTSSANAVTRASGIDAILSGS